MPGCDDIDRGRYIRIELLRIGLYDFLCDFTALNAAVTDGKDAIDAAQAVLDDPDATPDDVAAAEQALQDAINAFLASLPRKKRSAFLLRYWHAEPVSAIAKRLGMTENSVSVTLHRTRAALRDYLTERGFDV